MALAPIVVGVDELAGGMITGATDPGLFRRRPTITNRQIKQMARLRAASRSPQRAAVQDCAARP